MTNYGPMESVGPPNTKTGDRLATCPSCGFRALMDREQYRGEVSVNCLKCDYHETHDLEEKDGSGRKN